ncbi:S-adenosyl-L-methionine-dependent methyltransferase [Phlegmacium glaucopus]|nr:S-adenosyl-L-methionine-dependent methyltransferase [Phlegmacium glaucopus]
MSTQHNHHIHEHAGHHHHDVAQANRDHFDKTAKNFDAIPHAIARGERSAEAIRKEYPFDKDVTTMMEYACGTGLVSGNLAPYAKSILGVDISQGVVDLFNKRFADRDADQGRFRAIRAELKGEDGELDDEKFDVIICTSAYHHFEDVSQVTRLLVHFLKPSGALIVIDNMETPVPKEYHHLVIHRHGFDESEIQKIFGDAGLTSITYGKMPAVDGDVALFIAKGIKSAV